MPVLLGVNVTSLAQQPTAVLQSGALLGKSRYEKAIAGLASRPCPLVAW